MRTLDAEPPTEARSHPCHLVDRRLHASRFLELYGNSRSPLCVCGRQPLITLEIFGAQFTVHSPEFERGHRRSMTLRLVAALLGLFPTAWILWRLRRRESRLHEIRMIGDASGFRFEPARFTIARGDSVMFRVVSGQPYTVAFDTTAIARNVARELGARMSDEIGKLSDPLLLFAGDRYLIRFTGLPAGRYPFVCLPHLGRQMMGEIVVQ